MKEKYYICPHCGNICATIKESGVPLMCCGEKMKELIPGTVEAAHEKHIPVYSIDKNVVNVQVGSILHPMIEQHYIEWIEIKTKQGIQRKYLKPGDLPKASFVLSDDDELESIYEYCNLHGLWKSNI